MMKVIARPAESSQRKFSAGECHKADKVGKGRLSDGRDKKRAPVKVPVLASLALSGRQFIVGECSFERFSLDDGSDQSGDCRKLIYTYPSKHDERDKYDLHYFYGLHFLALLSQVKGYFASLKKSVSNSAASSSRSASVSLSY